MAMENFQQPLLQSSELKFVILKLDSKSFTKKNAHFCAPLDIWKDISMNINIKTFFV